jgi:1,4-alpha-glucan branching enzyme
MMYPSRTNGADNRYSAKNISKPVNFFCIAPAAQNVSLIGDFNQWHPNATPMTRQADGSWQVQVPLHHGHHRYQFLVDGVPALDPRAQGVTRNDQNERVSMMSVS